MAPEPQLRDPDRAELPSLILRGVGWKITSQIATHASRMVVLIVLARILGPQDFGIAAMALVLTAFVIALSDLGLGFALVQRKSITEADRSTVFWASVAIGTALTALCVAASPLVADFYNRDQVGPLFAVLSLGFLVTSFGSTQRSLLVRTMDFRGLELREMVGVIAGCVAAVVLAVMGFGPWALIGLYLTSSAVSTVMLWLLVDWRPRLIFSWASLRELGAFGLRCVGGTSFLTLNQNTDNILIGRVLGASALGVYSLAYSVILMPLSRIVHPLQQIMAPAFSRMQDDKAALNAGWIRGTRGLGVICLPLLITLSITAAEGVPLVFGTQWERAVPVVQILALVCALQSLLGLHNVVIQAVGRMRMYLWLSALSFALNLPAFVIGLHWGVTGVAAAFAVSTLAYGVILTILVARILEASAGAFARSLIGVSQAAIALALVELAVRNVLEQGGLDPTLRLIVTGVVGIGVFVPMCLWRVPELLPELRGVLGQIRGRRVRAAAQPAL